MCSDACYPERWAPSRLCSCSTARLPASAGANNRCIPGNSSAFRKLCVPGSMSGLRRDAAGSRTCGPTWPPPTCAARRRSSCHRRCCHRYRCQHCPSRRHPAAMRCRPHGQQHCVHLSTAVHTVVHAVLPHIWHCCAGVDTSTSRIHALEYLYMAPMPLTLMRVKECTWRHCP